MEFSNIRLMFKILWGKYCNFPASAKEDAVLCKFICHCLGLQLYFASSNIHFFIFLRCFILQPKLC